MNPPQFQHFCGDEPPRFAHPSELELAQLIDESGTPWCYEPHTFPLRYAADGTVAKAFTPDFFLPDVGIYIELTTQLRKLGTPKRRKVREVRARYGIVVMLHERRHFERMRDEFAA